MNNEKCYKLLERYVLDNPATGARHLQDLESNESVEILSSFMVPTCTQLLDHFPPTYVAELIKLTDLPASMLGALQHSSPDTCASILLSLPKGKRERFIQGLGDALKEQMRETLAFPDNSAGSIAKTDYTALRGSLTVSEAISQIRKQVKIVRSPTNIFIVDAARILIGIVSMRALVLANEQDILSNIMSQRLITVDGFDDKATAYELINKHHIASIPVVNGTGKFIGVVRAETLIEETKDIQVDNIQTLFGVGKEERPFSPPIYCLKRRLPWLYINLLTAFMAASVVSLFEGVIAQITVLAVYLPVIAGQGGNAGAQSLAVVMRGLVMREIPMQQAKRLIFKELTVGLINGVAVGTVTGLIAWLWQGNPYLGLVVGLSMFLILAIAGLAGAGIPLIMKKMNMDPAQSSNIILTTVTDVSGFFVFLFLAMLMKPFLL